MASLSPEQIAALLKRDKTPAERYGREAGKSGGGVFDNTVVSGSATIPPSELKWCDFCKGNYNEYHFGDIDE